MDRWTTYKACRTKALALGSDYDSATSVYFDTSELSVLTEALLDEGLNENLIPAVMGGNQIRFFEKYLPH